MGSRTLEFAVEVIVEPDEGSFHAFCPALKGLHVDGTTEEEALRNARDAAIAYLLSLIKHGDPIPIGLVMTGHTTIVGDSQPPKTHSHIENLHVRYARI